MEAGKASASRSAIRRCIRWVVAQSMRAACCPGIRVSMALRQRWMISGYFVSSVILRCALGGIARRTRRPSTEPEDSCTHSLVGEESHRCCTLMLARPRSNLWSASPIAHRGSRNAGLLRNRAIVHPGSDEPLNSAELLRGPHLWAPFAAMMNPRWKGTPTGSSASGTVSYRSDASE